MYNRINGAFCMSEFALGIALTVFVATTVILLLLIVCLAASKSFRTLFFRERKERQEKPEKVEKVEKPQKPQRKKTEDVDDGTDEIPLPPIKRETPSEKQDDLGFLESVETVPLQAMTLPAENGRTRRVPARRSSGGTYSPRMITITRAGGGKKPSDGETPASRGTNNDRRKGD